jgi:hypothetical protein
MVRPLCSVACLPLRYLLLEVFLSRCVCNNRVKRRTISLMRTHQTKNAKRGPTSGEPGARAGQAEGVPDCARNHTILKQKNFNRFYF